MRTRLLVVLLFVFSSAAGAAEILPLNQVSKGMKGYGLTVFEGTKVDRFNVEVLGILQNIGPRQDIILIHVDSPVTDKAGVIAGMSGSPVYIDGKLIGALAYGWQFASDSIAGVTPIEEMLRIGATPGSGTAPAVAPRMSGTEFLKSLISRDPAGQMKVLLSSLAPAQKSALGGASPIAVPLSFSNFSSDTLNRFGAYFADLGFLAVPSGSTNARPGPAESFHPGDAIAGVLVAGDFSVAATGTVTHVDGDKVYAFGHPFLNMGEISFPMAKSEVVAVLPNLATSAKFANSGAIVGTLTQDRFAGILGVMGEDAEMIPVQLTIDGAGNPQSYNFKVVRNPQLSPLLFAMAADSVVANVQRGAGERTVVMDSEIAVDGFPPIRLHEGWAGADARQSIPAYLAIVSSYLLSNEFHHADIRNVKINLHHADDLKIAKLLEASIETPADGEVNPGDVVRVRTLLKPFRGEPFTEMFDVRVPEGQKPGSAYLFIGGGSAVNQLDFSLVPPDPQTLAQVVSVIERLHASTELMVGLYSQSEGAVTAGVYLPTLPPSVRAVLEDDSSNSARIPVRYHPAEMISRPLAYVVDGAAKIDLQIKPKL